jgi:Kef-type K+ transport system membrane component KefB
MSDTGLFLGQTLTAVLLPYMVWHGLRLRAWVPLVVAQILCGILLGPSALGRVAPELWQAAFGSSLPVLSGLAWLSVSLFAFLTGLHLDFEEIKQSRGRLALIGLSSIVVPGALGIFAGLWLAVIYPTIVGPMTGSWQFAAGIAIAVSVTALPVLGAILRETGLLGTRLGREALVCASASDGLLWVALTALLATLDNGTESLSSLLSLTLIGAGYVAFLLFILRPLLDRWLRVTGDADAEAVTIIIVGIVFGSAWVTELIGLHYILGAFIAGVIMPTTVRRLLTERLELATITILLPFFFMLTGLRTEIPSGSSVLVGAFIVTTLASVVGKFLGTSLPAYWSGQSPNRAIALGTLLQAKGLMEVIVLNILLEAGVLTPVGFTAMLGMALVTTGIVKPGIRLLATIGMNRLDPAHSKSPLSQLD